MQAYEILYVVRYVSHKTVVTLPHFLSIQQYFLTFSPFMQSHLRRDREKRVVMFNINYIITERKWKSKRPLVEK
jgi:hypothetical protein